MAANDGIVNEGRAVAEKARVGQPRSASGILMLDRDAGAFYQIAPLTHACSSCRSAAGHNEVHADWWCDG